MTKTRMAELAAAAVLLVLAVVAGYRALEQNSDPVAETSPAASTAAADPHPSWGRDQEAFWGDYFNGVRSENPWVARVPHERLTKESSIEVFARLGDSPAVTG